MLPAVLDQGGGDGFRLVVGARVDAGDLERRRGEAEAAGGVYGICGRKAKDELATFPEPALHLDAAAMGLDDPLRDGQPQTGALRFGRIEGDENAVLGFLRNAGA